MYQHKYTLKYNITYEKSIAKPYKGFQGISETAFAKQQGLPQLHMLSYIQLIVHLWITR